jgi:hypothetical protein
LSLEGRARTHRRSKAPQWGNHIEPAGKGRQWGRSQRPEVRPEEDVMFANQRRGSAGLGSIGAVAAVIAIWLLSTGVMVRSWHEGGHLKGATCQVVCQTSTAIKAKG